KSSVTEKAGKTTVYAFHHEGNNHDQERHFCSACGTTLYWYLSTAPELVGIAGGCFADNGLPEPTDSYTHSKKEAWLTLPATWKVSPK
ncbi:MAG: GFA family protein, partial [Ideonella sp.]